MKKSFPLNIKLNKDELEYYINYIKFLKIQKQEN